MSPVGQTRKSSPRANVFRNAPDNGRERAGPAVPVLARLGHRSDYSITSSARASSVGGASRPRRLSFAAYCAALIPSACAIEASWSRISLFRLRIRPGRGYRRLGRSPLAGSLWSDRPRPRHGRRRRHFRAAHSTFRAGRTCRSGCQVRDTDSLPRRRSECRRRFHPLPAGYRQHSTFPA